MLELGPVPGGSVGRDDGPKRPRRIGQGWRHRYCLQRIFGNATSNGEEFRINPHLTAASAS